MDQFDHHVAPDVWVFSIVFPAWLHRRLRCSIKASKIPAPIMAPVETPSTAATWQRNHAGHGTSLGCPKANHILNGWKWINNQPLFRSKDLESS